MATPALAQSFSSAGAQTPAQGARQALDRARQAEDLAVLNMCVTRQTAAILGLGLVLVGNSNGSGKAFQDKVAALMSRYSLTRKLLDVADKSNTLPPGLAPRGHQFLADALTLKEAHEKNPTPGKSKIFDDKFIGSDLPASKDCIFRVLSPTRIQIVPHAQPKSPLEARLEEGQWRIDLGSLTESSVNNSAPPKPKTTLITPQAAAFIKAVDDGDAATVSRMLKANPALANTPPAYLKAHSEEVSDFPLTIASLRYNVPVATLLLKAGANVNAENDFGETALDQAAQYGSKATILLLLAHGAAIAHKNAFGKTALHLAAESRSGAVAVAILLAHGAPVNARDDEGMTPLALALDPSNHGADSAAIIKLLHQRGAKK